MRSITKAIEYCLKRWQALTRYLDDGNLPIDNSGQKIRCALGLSGVRIGCLLGRLRAVSGRLVLCRLSSQLD